MIVSTVQMPIEDGNCEVNRITLARILDKNPGADLYLAPELWSTGYTVSKWPALAEKDTPNTVIWMSEQAKLRGIWFAGSVIHKHVDGGITNRFVLFNRNGELVVIMINLIHFYQWGRAY
jgi:predicted amidohydrolase